MKQIRILTILCGVLTGLSFLYYWGVEIALRLFMLFKGFAAPQTDASAVGIIGGADGPTAIFISSSLKPASKIFFSLLFAVLTAAGVLWSRKLKGNPKAKEDENGPQR